ncbi:MAG: hypothetical protein R3C59_00420 [Planctomycetaceae bacterium]
MRRIQTAWFPILLTLIAMVSLYDTFLIVIFQEDIYWTEENPLGIWLLRAGGGNVGVFVRTKLAGTVIVLSSLTWMRIHRSRKAFPVTTSIAAYQTGLFTYLTFF